MTEREKLFLYHGICIGAGGSDGNPPAPVTPLMNEIACPALSELRQEVRMEIIEAINAAHGRLAAKN